jgi:RES domain-containing protein
VQGLRDPAAIVASSSLVKWSGRVWRCHHRLRAALNADGSLGDVGGRFNAGNKSVISPSFRALYSSVESAGALLEVIRHLAHKSVDAHDIVALEDLAMRVLSQFDVELQQVFDWSLDRELKQVLTSPSSAMSYAYTQQLAAAAIAAGAEAIIVPSATGIDANLVIFVDGLSEISRVDVIRRIEDLRPIAATIARI